MKEFAVDPGGDRYAAALHALFDLDPAAVTALTQTLRTSATSRTTCQSTESRVPEIRVATRASALARAQTGWVRERIQAVTGGEVSEVLITTEGDTSTAALTSFGGQGVRCRCAPGADRRAGGCRSPLAEGHADRRRPRAR